MKPIFTIHAGEYLVGSHIEENLVDKFGNKVNVWIPSRDTGIDLLVTDKQNKNTTSIQVKFSKDFLITHGRPEYQQNLISCGWWTLNRDKIRTSGADFWVFVLHTFNEKNMQYVILPPHVLLERMDHLHPKSKLLQTYLWVSASGQCWETRGLKKRETDSLVLEKTKPSPERDFSVFLNNWDVIFTSWK